MTEGGNVTVTFGPNMKGTTQHRRLNMPGIITSVGDEAGWYFRFLCYELHIIMNCTKSQIIFLLITAKQS